MLVASMPGAGFVMTSIGRTMCQSGIARRYYPWLPQPSRKDAAQMRQLEAAAKAAGESQAEATAVQEAMSGEAKRAQASMQPQLAPSWSGCCS